MKILVVGAGGVGGYFGARLAEAGESVWFLARGPHLEAMQQHGLTVNAADAKLTVPANRIIAHGAELPSAPELILFCVKSYDTNTAARALQTHCGSGCSVLSLQNGVDNEDALAAILPHARIFGGAAYVYSTITAPGVITEGGGPRKIVFGPMDGQLDDQAHSLHETFVRSGISADLTADVAAALWKKFIFIAAVGGMTALTRLELGEILGTPETSALLRRAMIEVEDLARARGLDLGEAVTETFLEKLRGFNTHTRSSLSYDLEHGRPMEIEALSGTVVRLGRQLRIPTPVHEIIYASLLPHHLRHISR